MNVVIPETLRKKVRERARKHGVTEAAYIHTVIREAVSADDDLEEEMQLWERSSLRDFGRFAKKHKV
ncbi:MAG: hypothetical protein AAB665_04255 [Patescibacteria group bacterium]